MLRFMLLLLVAALVACASPRGPGKVVVNEELGKPWQGLRAAEPDLLESKERLDIFLGVQHPPPEEGEEPLVESTRWADVIYCVARNPGEKPLPEVDALIKATPPDKTIYVWGSPITKKDEFFWDGVDCKAEAIAVYHPKAQDYVYFDLVYSRPWWEWQNIKGGLKALVEAGRQARKAMP